MNKPISIIFIFESRLYLCVEFFFIHSMGKGNIKMNAKYNFIYYSTIVIIIIFILSVYFLVPFKCFTFARAHVCVCCLSIWLMPFWAQWISILRFHNNFISAIENNSSGNNNNNNFPLFIVVASLLLHRFDSVSYVTTFTWIRENSSNNEKSRWHNQMTILLHSHKWVIRMHT